MLNLFTYFPKKIQQFLSKNVSILSDENMIKMPQYDLRGQNISIPQFFILLTRTLLA